jgi:hypothetical protein
MRLSESQAVQDLSLEEMVEELVRARESLESQRATVHYIERAVVEAMQERGATVVRTDAGEATLTTPVTYDYGILAGLREITSPNDLVGYTPEREVVKVEPERWNLTQAKALAKLSHHHAATIEAAKIYGNPRLKIQNKRAR